MTTSANDSERPGQHEGAAGGSGKKPYTRPTIEEYGSVEKLTRGSSGRRGDGGGTRRP